MEIALSPVDSNSIMMSLLIVHTFYRFYLVHISLCQKNRVSWLNDFGQFRVCRRQLQEADDIAVTTDSSKSRFDYQKIIKALRMIAWK